MLPVLERSDVENARIAGMATDLNLVGNVLLSFLGILN